MDSLQQIIKSLKKEEVRNFRLLAAKYQRTDDSKSTLLFDSLRGGKFGEAEDSGTGSQGDEGNANAHHRLRNRLKVDIEKSLLNLHFSLDDKISAVNLLALANIFRYKAQYALSLYYYQRAEKICTESEYYDLLEHIYNELITLSDSFNEINPLVYIEKRKENFTKYQSIQQANHAIAAISYRLRRTNFSNKANDITAELEKVAAELEIANEIYNLSSVRLKIHVCVRDSLLQDGRFDVLEDFLLSDYRSFNQSEFFNKSNHKSKLNLLTWIINTLIINRNYDLAFEYTRVLGEELERFDGLLNENYFWTYNQSLTTLYMFTGQLNEALALLEDIRGNEHTRGVQYYDYALHVNLALNYYYLRQPSQAIKTLSHLFSKDNYSRLSPELQLSLTILESILHYDNDNLDYASYKVDEAKRLFKTLLKGDAYSEERTFLKLLSAILNKPDGLADKKLKKEIDVYLASAQPFHAGSSKHIDFAIWIKSKIEKKPYYQLMLQSVAPSAANPSGHLPLPHAGN